MNLQHLQSRIDTWRSEGAWRIDAARFRYLESLARRLPQQPEAVQRLLLRRLESAVQEFAQRLAAAGGAFAVRRPARMRPAAGASGPLARLNAHLRELRGDAPGAQELASVRRFRRSWSGGRVHEQVRQALERRPAVAGPLNSHMLVLQVLETLQALSPDYLRRFVAQVESLQWLAQATVQYPGARSKSAKGGKASKPGRRR